MLLSVSSVVSLKASIYCLQVVSGAIGASAARQGKRIERISPVSQGRRGVIANPIGPATHVLAYER